MGFLAALALLGLIAYWLFQYVVSPEKRADANRGLKEKPWEAISLLFFCAAFLAFFLGILIPSLGMIPTPIGGVEFKLWQLGGIGCLTWFVGFLVVEAITKQRRI